MQGIWRRTRAIAWWCTLGIRRPTKTMRAGRSMRGWRSWRPCGSARRVAVHDRRGAVRGAGGDSHGPGGDARAGPRRQPCAACPGPSADPGRPGAKPGAPGHGGHQPGHPAAGRGVCGHAGVGDVSPGRCQRAPAGLPGAPGAGRPESVCRHGHARSHPAGGPGTGTRAAARALGAGQRRAWGRWSCSAARPGSANRGWCRP